jgi:acyl-homoserine-lactone acylase
MPRELIPRNLPVSRSTMRCFPLFMCFALTAILISSSPAGADRSAPRAPLNAAVLAKTVTIHRDRFGVPHVFAPTDAGCIFGFVNAQAEDYFWQIEDSYIRSLGRAAEVYGERALPEDLLNHALEITRLAQEEYASAPPRSKEFCQALAEGLNFFLATHPEIKPRLLPHFEPWHSLAFRRYMLYQAFIYQKSGLSVSEITSAVQEIKDGQLGSVQLDAQVRADLSQTETLRDCMDQHIGSNMWAVRPEKSATGKALLFINPHQPFFGPGQWYEGHLVSGEGWNLSGACFFGSPHPTIGYNGYLAWSHTVNSPDIVDTYAISFDDPQDPLKYRYGEGTKQAVAWTATVNVKKSDNLAVRQFLFTKTHYGPLVAVRDKKPLAIKLAKLQDGGALEEWYAMGKAKSVAEFKAAMKPCNIPMFNAMVADNAGDIFYVYNGAIPKRSTKFDWSKPVDGSNPETEWQGYHTFEELPQLENPQCGFLQNCNQQPFTTTPLAGELKRGEVEENPKPSQFPAYFFRERERDNSRARISRRILHAQAKFDFDAWAKAGFNTKVIEAETRVPEVIKEWEALSKDQPERAAKLKEVIELIQAWDCTSTVDSVPMTLFALTYERLMQMVQKRDLFKSPRIRALEATLADLQKNYGTWKVAWGEINRLQRIHGSQIDLQGRGAFNDAAASLPVAGSPGPLGIVFNFYTLSQAGLKRRYGVAGHSYVGVVELADQPRARSILQFGESGDPSSPHWFDQARLYAQGQFKPSWYAQADIEANSEAHYHPGEKAAATK